MDYRRETGFSDGNVVQILAGNHRNAGKATGNWEPEWATDDDYRIWNNESSQTQSDSVPQNKKTRNTQVADLTASNPSKSIGKMFYKTKLCSKFRDGNCPYVTNCNFAHSVEELRKLPPNWQEIVAGRDEDHGASSEPREEFQIPILGVSDDAQRSYKGRHCKKFYTEEGCPYGEGCTFLHDEQSKTRESEAICLGPSCGGGSARDGAGALVGAGSGNNNENSNNTGNNVFALKPSNWKTRICNKWELTGYCPFGSKCHFAHGAAELHQFGGDPLDRENKDSTTPDAMQGASTSAKTTIAGSHPSMPHSEGPPQRLFNANTKAGQRPHKWKGPDKISKIYGDWIDDFQ